MGGAIAVFVLEFVTIIISYALLLKNLISGSAVGIGAGIWVLFVVFLVFLIVSIALLIYCIKGIRDRFIRGRSIVGTVFAATDLAMAAVMLIYILFGGIALAMI